MTRDDILAALDAALERCDRAGAWALLHDLALDIEQRIEGLRDTEKPDAE